MHVVSPLPDSAYASRLDAASLQFWEGYGGGQNPIGQNPPGNPPDDPLEINGVRMTQVAIEQLRLLGLPLTWYTPDELEDAVVACQADARLIDDPHGDDLQDKLRLDASETCPESFHEPPHEASLPVLHGFHPDEYERIMAGLRLLCDPVPIGPYDPVRSGWMRLTAAAAKARGYTPRNAPRFPVSGF